MIWPFRKKNTTELRHGMLNDGHSVPPFVQRPSDIRNLTFRIRHGGRYYYAHDVDKALESIEKSLDWLYDHLDDKYAYVNVSHSDSMDVIDTDATEDTNPNEDDGLPRPDVLPNDEDRFKPEFERTDSTAKPENKTRKSNVDGHDTESDSDNHEDSPQKRIKAKKLDVRPKPRYTEQEPQARKKSDAPVRKTPPVNPFLMD